MEWHRGSPHFVLTLLALAVPLNFAEGGESPRMGDVRGHYCMCLIDAGVLSKSGFSYVSDHPYLISRILALLLFLLKRILVSDTHYATRLPSNLT